ncbi:MAG: methyltransferase domain-containing protein [Chitinispirillaceae bacterium]
MGTNIMIINMIIKRILNKFNLIFSIILLFPRIIKTFFKRTDYKRWKNSNKFEEWWRSRSEKISQIIPKNSRVIEFGAGCRWLERYLDRSCVYLPSDLIDRGSGTIICDLNKRPLPDFQYLNVDVAVFSGVIEYINDLPSVIQWLSNFTISCAASYECVKSPPHTVSRFVETFKRRYSGFVNTYNEEELISLFNKYGFVCLKKITWDTQKVFLFKHQKK